MTVKIYLSCEGQYIKYGDGIQVILEQWFQALHKRVGLVTWNLNEAHETAGPESVETV